MYRFRKLKHIFDFKELENQEIYFSDLNSLNDPMEGFKKIYWEGDEILWRNFFRHYLLCLENAVTIAYLSDDIETFNQNNINVFLSIKHLPTDIYKTMLKEIFDDFFKQKGINEIIDILSSQTNGINQDELFVYLKLFHLRAFKSIMDIHKSHGLNSSVPIKYPDLSDSFLTALKELQKTDDKEKGHLQILFSIFKSFLTDIDMKSAYNLKSDRHFNKKYFIINNFSSAYIKQIERLIYPNSYIASFCNECSNPVLWGHYAENHTGIALKFKTQKLDDFYSINLNGTIGVQANKNGTKLLSGNRKFNLKKINYSKDFPNINFFTSLGNIPLAQIDTEWFTENSDKVSRYIQNCKFKIDEEWRKKYWIDYEQSLLIKFEDWKYEDEYRLILSDLGVVSKEEKNDRKFNYNFNDLESITFGLKTPVEAKLKIIELIESKCKINNRNNFEFYQAQYNLSTGKINPVKIVI